MRGTAITVVVLAALVLCAELHAIPAGYWMTDLGPGAAYAINNSGQVVGIRPFPNRPQWQAFLWDNGVFTNLDTLGYHSWAYDINESGQVVGHIFKTVGPNISFLYDNGVTRSLEIWEDDHDSSAVGINDQGEITGWVSVGGTRGYRLDEQGYTELEDLRPADIGPDGCIVGKTVEWTNRLERAFTWQDNVVTILPTLAGESGARSINSEAQIVGFSEDAEENRHPVLWDNGVMENLYPVAGTEAGAFDINETGQVVGTLRMGSGPWSAFIWDNGTVYELNNLITESRYTLTGGAAINDLGQIVCQAWDTEREDYVIALLNPIPEPATLSLIAMGFIGLICRARRMNGRTRTTRE